MEKFGHTIWGTGYDEERTMDNFERYEFYFENGYGASVVRYQGKNDCTYGGQEGLWELAVLDKDGNITYQTSITSDVIGWLDDSEVEDVLNNIKDLVMEEGYIDFIKSEV